MESKISCIVVEDEERSLNLMTNLLNQIPRVQLAASFLDSEEAFQYLKQNAPDLIFLDIKMPKMDGFQFIEKLDQENLIRPFIFVTAYEEFLIDALRKSALDYLMKPVSLKQLEEAIDRFEKQSSEPLVMNVRQKVKALNTELLRFNFKTGFDIIRRSDILFLEADGNYTRIVLTDKREITISQNLGQFNYLLEEDQLIKIHRSFIINPHYFRKINRLTKSCILVHNGEEYKVSVSSKGLKVLDNYFSPH